MKRSDREKLFEENRNLVDIVFKKTPFNVAEYHADWDDLKQAGLIALWAATDRYDQSTGNKFRSYAQYRIKGAMQDEIRRRVPGVRSKYGVPKFVHLSRVQFLDEDSEHADSFESLFGVDNAAPLDVMMDAEAVAAILFKVRKHVGKKAEQIVRELLKGKPRAVVARDIGMPYSTVVYFMRKVATCLGVSFEELSPVG